MLNTLVNGKRRVCPTFEQLEAFAHGGAAEDQIDSIGAHIDECEHCLSVAEGRRKFHDSAIAILMAAPTPTRAIWPSLTAVPAGPSAAWPANT